MKYIRMKADGRIIAYDEKANELDKPAILFYKNDYIEADTIEELCDEFIGYSSNKTRYMLITFEQRKMYPLIKELYGAVWTDKGLIYVAKMNEEGELELL